MTSVPVPTPACNVYFLYIYKIKTKREIPSSLMDLGIGLELCVESCMCTKYPKDKFVIQTVNKFCVVAVAVKFSICNSVYIPVCVHS